MLRPVPHRRYSIAAILAAHWISFVAQYKRWIRPVVFENVRKVLACRTPVLGCHIYRCNGCGHVELIPHSCKSRFCPACGKHATDVWSGQVLNKLWPFTWYAYIGASLLDPRFSIQYIGRYTKRAVMAEYRITYYDGKIVRFTYKDYAQGGKTAFMTLKVHTFIARLIRHIPDKHFPMIRYAGLFSNRWKNHYLSQVRRALKQTDHDDIQTDRLASWAERQTQYTGIDPLTCPNCDQPLTYVGTFFGNWSELQCLFDSAGKDSAIPYALLRPG